MNYRDQAELSSIKAELNSIITELESVSNGIYSDFIGIGAEKCSASIDKVVSQYRNVKMRLDRLDTSTHMQWWIDENEPKSETT